MKHISFDLETLDTGPQACILSIGAVKFDPFTGELGDTFSAVIDIEKPGGGTVSASTVAWWMRQSQQARDAIFGPDVVKTQLAWALVAFSEFIGFDDSLPDGEYPDVTLWQRGDKDATWLLSAYEGTQLKAPFRYWQVRDQRTATVDYPHLMPTPEAHVAHNSLHDAVYQAKALIAVYSRLYSSGALLPPVDATAPAVPGKVDWVAMASLSQAGTVGEFLLGLEATGDFSPDEIADAAAALSVFDADRATSSLTGIEFGGDHADHGTQASCSCGDPANVNFDHRNDGPCGTIRPSLGGAVENLIESRSET